MKLIERLKKKKIHPCKEIFDNFERSAIASELGIRPGYLSSIMNGSRIAGYELNDRIHTLAKKIEKELGK